MPLVSLASSHSLLPRSLRAPRGRLLKITHSYSLAPMRSHLPIVPSVRFCAPQPLKGQNKAKLGQLRPSGEPHRVPIRRWRLCDSTKRTHFAAAPGSPGEFEGNSGYSRVIEDISRVIATRFRGIPGNLARACCGRTPLPGQGRSFTKILDSGGIRRIMYLSGLCYPAPRGRR